MLIEWEGNICFIFRFKWHKKDKHTRHLSKRVAYRLRVEAVKNKNRPRSVCKTFQKFIPKKEKKEITKTKINLMYNYMHYYSIIVMLANIIYYLLRSSWKSEKCLLCLSWKFAPRATNQCEATCLIVGRLFMLLLTQQQHKKNYNL